MSEYQFVHFIAIDRPLDDQQLEFMQKQSTRATVTRRQFRNEYHFGSFHGKTQEMMRRGFDLHVHFANYGIRRLAFRLPHGFPGGITMLQPYLIEDQIQWDEDQRGRGGILSIHPEGDGEFWDGYYYDLEKLLTELTPVREMLINGDLRPLYLAWLACASSEDAEPPVPAGMKTLPKPLQKLADFYELPDDLLEAAADESMVMKEPVSKSLPVRTWLESKSKQQRLKLLVELLNDESGVVRADALQSIRELMESSAWPVTPTNRTMEDIFQRAIDIEAARQHQDEEAARQQRLKRLADMAENRDKTVAEISELAAMRTKAKYAEAVALLCDLREALGDEIGPDYTATVAEKLRAVTPRYNGLIAILKKHHFL